jgi:hypothetical protein
MKEVGMVFRRRAFITLVAALLMPVLAVGIVAAQEEGLAKRLL